MGMYCCCGVKKRDGWIQRRLCMERGKMKPDCECQNCKHKVDEYFCFKCKYNFNECESFFKFDGITLCPKCHPETCETFVYRPKNYPGPVAIDRKPSKECDEYHKNVKIQINITKNFKIEDV